MVDSDQDLPPDDRQDSDYDGAWKEALRRHLPEFMDRCFADLAQLIDWRHEAEWLDKEISQIIGQLGHRNREVDLLFKVRLKNGSDQWIFCHLEIQTSYEIDFARRIDLYNAGLKWTFRQEVLTLVILADQNAGWIPRNHHFELGGFRCELQFPSCKLLERLATEWVDDMSLVAQVARAQIAAFQTASNPEARFTAKTQLVRNLYTAGYNATQLRELFLLIDWMMHLRSDLDRRFKTELITFEKELQMPYVTSVERIAKEEGREEESTTLLLLQLTRRFGALPAEIEQNVRTLSLEVKRRLGESLFDFKSLPDLTNWLKSGSAS